jgi:transposase InsO family protein
MRRCTASSLTVEMAMAYSIARSNTRRGARFLQAALAAFEHTYNHVRSHQALGYRVPAAVLATSINV